jgi:hypothetical protein
VIWRQFPDGWRKVEADVAYIESDLFTQAEDAAAMPQRIWEWVTLCFPIGHDA